MRGASNQVFAAPRIYDDLLSSQPLCFNLFGELKQDMKLATRLFEMLRPGAVHSVVDIRFEYSPGRGENRFTGDRSAFDVFVEYRKPDGARGFLGIEVKYHEDMLEVPAAHRRRYDEVAAAMGCFRPEALPALRRAPIEQLWRDHLLSGITQRELGYDEGVFILLYPAANIHCRRALGAYRATLCDNSTFDGWTLEEVISLLTMMTPAGWVRSFRNRYLDFDRLGAG